MEQPQRYKKFIIYEDETGNRIAVNGQKRKALFRAYLSLFKGYQRLGFVWSYNKLTALSMTPRTLGRCWGRRI